MNSLEELILRFTKIKSLPSLEHCTHIKEIDLSNSSLETVPRLSDKCDRGFKILLQHTHITDLSPLTPGLKKMNYLKIKGTNVEEFPDEWIGTESHAKVDLGNTSFHNILTEKTRPRYLLPNWYSLSAEADLNKLMVFLEITDFLPPK